jgi:hypothetical protein
MPEARRRRSGFRACRGVPVRLESLTHGLAGEWDDSGLTVLVERGRTVQDIDLIAN